MVSRLGLEQRVPLIKNQSKNDIYHIITTVYLLII